MTRAAEYLVVIEAPGKRRGLEHVLQVAARDRVLVYATGGHILRYGKSLWPTGVVLDANGVVTEPGRRADPDKVGELQALAAGRQLVLATDSDDEGDVIARDVANLCEGHSVSVERMRFSALDSDSIWLAWSQRKPWVSQRGVLPGDVRRIVDRIVASVYTRPGRPAGRVLSSFLTMAAAASPAQRLVGHATLSLPAEDQGVPFVAHVPVSAEMLPHWRDRMMEWSRAAPLGKPSGKTRVPDAPVWGYSAWILQGILGRPPLNLDAIPVMESRE